MDNNTSRVVDPSSNLEAALASVAPGDGLVLSGGDYFLHRPLIVDDRFLQGNGADVARIHGTVVLSGASQVWAIGVHAPKDGPAFDVVSGFPTLNHCAARLRPDAEKVAVRVNDAGLELDSCVVEETEERPALVATKAHLLIERSRVGYINVGAESKASVSQSTLGAVRVNGGAIMALDGACAIAPAGGDSALMVDSGGKFTAPQLYFKGDNPYISVDDAYVDIPRIQTDGERVRVNAEDGAQINLDSEMCVVAGGGSNAGEVLWRAADGDKFDDLIVPQLAPGTVVRMEEGEYVITGLSIHAGPLTFIGPGTDECTVWVSASVDVDAGQELNVSGMTLIQAPDDMVIYNHGGRVRAYEVRFVPGQHPINMAQIGADNGGVLEFDECVVESPQSRPWVGVVAAENSELYSQASMLGWVRVDESTANFDGDWIYYLEAEGATITGEVSIMENHAGKRAIHAKAGTDIDLTALGLLAYDTELYLGDSALRADEVVAAPKSDFRVYAGGTSTVNAPGARLFERRGGEWVDTSETGGSEAGQPKPAVRAPRPAAEANRLTARPVGAAAGQPGPDAASAVVDSLRSKGYTFDEAQLRQALASVSPDNLGRAERKLVDAISIRLFRTYGGNFAPAGAEERTTITADDLRSLGSL
ncbi:hypothetical protein V6D40_06580 [Corynebacterium sp. Q4381]|uniref:hypothetical protein n=1 Tax=Corynebacterium sp. Marseille-Q4381 TaxID=3121597 RepID=UPI002FE566DC